MDLRRQASQGGVTHAHNFCGGPLASHLAPRPGRQALVGRVPVVDIATTFPVGKPRNSAMAVYGAMSALGITGGVLLGGS